MGQVGGRGGRGKLLGLCRRPACAPQLNPFSACAPHMAIPIPYRSKRIQQTMLPSVHNAQTTVLPNAHKTLN